MQPILLKSSVIYTRRGRVENGWLIIENGRIAYIGTDHAPSIEHTIDVGTASLLPGFIDLHTHGAAGFSTLGASQEALYGMARFFAAHGVTGFLAALITTSQETMLRSLSAVAMSMGPIAQGAALLGSYLEGPCISVAAKGAHDERFIRRADPNEYGQWLAMGAVKQITVAPEFPENIPLICACVEHDIVVTVGHSTATYEQVKYAVELGARQSTHTFNAMTGMHHRMPGTTGASLTHDEIMCELIVDFVHVHPAMVKLAVRAKGVDNVVLVTDSEAGVGMPVGSCCGNKLIVGDNAVYLESGALAGSCLTMNKALQNCIAATGLTLEQAWPMSSYNAARQLGLGHTKGLLDVGYDADIVAIFEDDFSVMMTMSGGNVTHLRSP